MRRLIIILGIGIGGIAQQPSAPSCATLTVGGASVCNTAIVATHDQIHFNESLCSQGNGTFGYTCFFGSLNKALPQYKIGELVLHIPDVPCTSNQNCTLNIDGLGPITIKESDGITGATLIAKHGYVYFFNGQIFQKVG